MLSEVFDARIFWRLMHVDFSFNFLQRYRFARRVKKWVAFFGSSSVVLHCIALTNDKLDS